MYFIFCGEGKTDSGQYEDQPGPLALVADQIIDKHYGYSFIGSNRSVFIHRAELERIKDSIKPVSRRSVRLPNPNVKPETRFHYDDARAFSRAAKSVLENVNEDNAEFVAILFHDSDSPDKKVWDDKRNSILWGFYVERIEKRGVAAVARPVSEVWWLSAIYRSESKAKDCRYLEKTENTNALKSELAAVLKTAPSRFVLNDLVAERKIDYTLIDSESFHTFQRDFETAVGLEHLRHTKATL